MDIAQRLKVREETRQREAKKRPITEAEALRTALRCCKGRCCGTF